MSIKNKAIKFEVLGEPRGKQRPRMCRTGGKTIAYTPKPTKDYEKRVKMAYQVVSKAFFDKDVPVEIDIKAYFAIPHSTPDGLKKQYLSKKLLPIKPPDVDNVAKIVCDALNGVAFCDDRQICKLNIEKYYSKIPKITVELKALEVITHD